MKVTRPRIPLTDPRFQYTPAARTNLRETFERIAIEHADPKSVRQIRKGAKS